MLISIGEIIKQSWQLYTKNFKTLIKPLLWIIGINLLITVFGYLKIQTVIQALTIVYTLLILWATIVLIDLINKIYQKQMVNLKESYNLGRNKIFSYIWVSILSGLAVTGGFILLIIPGFIFMVWFAFAAYYVVLENINGTAAMKASKKLVQGKWRAAFSRIVVPNLVYAIIVTILFFIIWLPAYLYFMIDPYSSPSGIIEGLVMGSFWLTTFIWGLIPILFTPLFIGNTVILFNSLKQTLKQNQVQTKS